MATTELVVFENGELTQDTIQRIIELKKQKKAIDYANKCVDEKIKQIMEEHGLIKLESPELTVTYVAATTAEKFDSKTFKAECPDIYDAYVKISEVSPSVRYKL